MAVRKHLSLLSHIGIKMACLAETLPCTRKNQPGPNLDPKMLVTVGAWTNHTSTT